MSDLRTLLNDGLRPGVYRWRSRQTVDEVRRDVAAAGWNFVLLDTQNVHDTAGLLDVCATAFDLPRWFGRSWNIYRLAAGQSDRASRPATGPAPSP